MTFSRRTFLGGVAAGAALSLATPSLVRAQETRTLRLGIVTPPGHPWNNAALKVGEALKAETNGRLSISVFRPASSATRRRCCSRCRAARSISAGS